MFLSIPLKVVSVVEWKSSRPSNSRSSMAGFESGYNVVALSKECLLRATPVVRVFAAVSRVCLAEIIFCFIAAMPFPQRWRPFCLKSSSMDCRIGNKSLKMA